jgi:hypothetical protein
MLEMVSHLFGQPLKFWYDYWYPETKESAKPALRPVANGRNRSFRLSTQELLPELPPERMNRLLLDFHRVNRTVVLSKRMNHQFFPKDYLLSRLCQLNSYDYDIPHSLDAKRMSYWDGHWEKICQDHHWPYRSSPV